MARAAELRRQDGEKTESVVTGGITADQLRAFIERIERLEEEKRTIADDIKEVYAEAKGEGFDTTIMREVIRIRRMDEADVAEREELIDVYKRALGMLPDGED